MVATANYAAEECEECGITIAVGDTYFMRNEVDDGTQDDPLVAALTALTYDAICQSCGEGQLRKDAN
jgi:hypothetical protein